MDFSEAPLLPFVDYTHLDKKDCISLSDLESGVVNDCKMFLEPLAIILKEEKIIQIPEFMTAHLCAYLGAITTLLAFDDATILVPLIVELIKYHSNVAFRKFNQYPINYAVSREEGEKNLENLIKELPGSILAQTISLGRQIKDIVCLLAPAKPFKSEIFFSDRTRFFCPKEKLLGLILKLAPPACLKWRKALNGLSDNYVINQFAIQVGWLMGYLFHLIDKPLSETINHDLGLRLIPIFQGQISEWIKNNMAASLISRKQDIQTENLMIEISTLSEKTHKILPPAMTDFDKRNALLMASYEKMLTDLVSQNFELRVIQDSLYYHWFFLEAPLHGAHPSWVEDENPWSHMQALMDLVIATVNKLPDPDLPREILDLNEKMQLLKAGLPSPLELDKISQEKLNEQSEKVDPRIHGLTCDFLKQKIPIDEITNVMFYYLLRYCTISGFAEHEWQKMNYYFSTIIANVRGYFKTAAEIKIIH